MICYLDSSILLRQILRQSRQLSEWTAIRTAISNRLLRLECFRTIDRLRITEQWSSMQVEEARRRCLVLLEGIGSLPVTEHVYRRAEQPFIVPVGFLDSLHLASALLWRETRGDDLIFATHDSQLALAARAHGLQVIGV